MGLFDALKAIKKTRDAGGNFAYIAQNFGTQYYIFSRTDYSFRLFPEEKYFAIAAINTMIPLQHGHIDIRDIADAVHNSEQCRVTLPGYSRQWSSNWATSEMEKLFNILLQIEVLTFKAYSKLDDQTIVLQVLSKMDSILEMFKKTVSQGQDSSLYNDTYNIVISASEDPEFQNLVSKYLDYYYGD